MTTVHTRQIKVPICTEARFVLFRHRIRLYNHSNFVSSQTRLVVTGQISGPVRAGYLTGHRLDQPQLVRRTTKMVVIGIPAKAIRVRAATASKATARPRPKPHGSTVRPSSFSMASCSNL